MKIEFQTPHNDPFQMHYVGTDYVPVVKWKTEMTLDGQHLDFDFALRLAELFTIRFQQDIKVWSNQAVCIVSLSQVLARRNMQADKLVKLVHVAASARDLRDQFSADKTKWTIHECCLNQALFDLGAAE